jgi:bifunctional non-homologous end joining protein LigD
MRKRKVQRRIEAVEEIAHSAALRPRRRTNQHDLFALGRPAPMPKSIEPSKPTLVDRAPSGPGWLHEIKFDGYRVLAFLSAGKVRLTGISVARGGHGPNLHPW